MKDIGILAFTQRGKLLAENMKNDFEGQWDSQVFDNRGKAGDFLKENFESKDGFVFICAAGIAVRLIAPLIKSKDVDPAVVVMDEFGQFVVPILSGHLGGANELAEEISARLGAEAVITTATDLNDKFAVDVWSKYSGCKIVETKDIKAVSAAMLRGEKVGIQSGFPFEGELPEGISPDVTEIGICVGLSEKLRPFPKTMNVVPSIITLGVGCRKNTSFEAFEKFILEILEEKSISIHAIEKIASIDLKKYEKCILKFSDKYQIPFVTYSAEELNRTQGIFEASDFVKSITGVDNICERSASLGSSNGSVILSKTSNGVGITAAMAMKEWKCKF